MKSNKVFVIAVAAIAIIAFGVFAFMSKNSQEAESAATPAVTNELLIKPHSYIKGNPDAKVTIVEFLDPECEACRQMHPVVKHLMSEYGDKVRLVIRYMPFHGNSMLAASILEEAREAGKFEEALDRLFENQPEWGDHHNPRPDLIPSYLQGLGLTEKQMEGAYAIPRHKDKIEMDYADGVKAGVMKTPTFFINGKMLPEIGFEPLKDAIDAELAK
jgi:Protein-disulfide isomerase